MNINFLPKTEGKTKKRNFTDCEVEVLVDEVEQCLTVLFGAHSMGVINAKKIINNKKNITIKINGPI